MTEVFIEKILLTDIDGIYSEMMLSLFWEQGMEYIRTVTALPHSSTEPRDPNLGPRTRKEDEALNGDLKYPGGHSVVRPADVSENPLSGDLSSDLVVQMHLEKEVWLNAAYFSWRPYRYSLRRESLASLIGGKPEAIGTLFFAPSRLCPTTFPMPPGSVPPDTIALTSLHYNVLEVDDDVLRVLIMTVLHRLALRGISAVEAFGCSGITDSMLVLTSLLPTPDDDTGNLIADFEAQFEEKLNPKPCISDSLVAINHNTGDLIRTWILLDSGFRAVTPHSIYPKFRIELDAELDWDEEIGRVLGLSAKESFMRSKLFSL